MQDNFLFPVQCALSLTIQETVHDIRNLNKSSFFKTTWQNPAGYTMVLFTFTSKIVFFTSLRICRFFSNVASISSRLRTTSGPRTPWKHGRGLFSPSYILAKWICPSHTYKQEFTNYKSSRFQKYIITNYTLGLGICDWSYVCWW